MEAAAIAQQVEAIAKSLAPNADLITPEIRSRALAVLVEFKRLEQLKAIAQSESNSTYFFGDKAAIGSGMEGAGGAWGVDYAEHVKAGIQKRGGAESMVAS